MKIGKKFSMFIVMILFSSFIFPDHSALADRRYLVGSGDFDDTAIWSTTSNGSGGASAPTSDDWVILDANSDDFKVRLVGNVSIDSLDIAAGTFDAVTYYLRVTNDINITGDSLLLGTNTGHIFRRNLNLSGSGILDCGSSTWNLRGDFVITGGTFNAGTSTLVFSNNDGSEQNLSSNTSLTLYNVTVNQANPDNELAGVNFDNNSDNFIVFTINGTLTMRYPDQDGITLTASGEFDPPILGYGSNSKLVYSGINPDTKSSQLTGDEFTATVNVNDLEINVAGSYTNGVDISGLGNRILRRNLTLTNGIITHGAGETISVGGTLSTGTLTTGGSYVGGTILMGGNQIQYVEAGTGSVANLTVNKTISSNIVYLNSNILKITGNFIVQNGIFELNPLANGLSLTSVSSVFRIQSGGTFRTGGKQIDMAAGSSFDLQAGSTFEFNGTTGQENTPSGITFSNITMNNGSGVNVVGDVVINGTLTFTADNRVLVSGGSNTLTFGLNASVSGTSSDRFILGPARKQFNSTSSFTYPVGFEVLGTFYYRPAIFTYTAGSFGENSIIRVAYSRSSFDEKTLPAGISDLDQSGHYIVTEVGTAPTGLAYQFTGTFDDGNFTPETRNRILVETTTSYTVGDTIDIDQNNNYVTCGSFNALPVDNQYIVFGAGGASVTWDGGDPDDDLWSSAENWDPDGVPTSTDDVTIDDADATEVTIGGTTAAMAQTLTLGGTYSPTLIVAGTSSNPLRIYQTTGTPLTVDNASLLQINNTNGIKFDPDGANQYDPNRTDYSSTSTVEYQAGTVQADSYGNLVVNGASGSSTSGTIAVGGDFTKQSATNFTASTEITVTGTYTNEAGNSTFNGGGLTMSGTDFIVTSGNIYGTVTFAGTSGQFISGAASPASFATLVINNSSGLTLSTPVQISTALTLTDGLIITTSGNLMTLVGNASATGNENSYIYGPLARTNATSSKEFPIGKSAYRPVNTNLTGSSPNVQFEVFDTPPNQSWNSPLVLISQVRYWLGTLTGSITGGSLTLTYGPDDGVQDGPDLRVAYSSDNSIYDELTGSGSTPGSGTVTGTLSSTALGLGYFTLGTVTLDNSLPVDLVSFTALGKSGKVLLSWQTASEVNNSGFEIYRSSSEDGTYQLVNNQLIPGSGNSTTSHRYEYADVAVEENTTYFYKLYSRDFDGTLNDYGSVISATVLALPKEFRIAQNYPNPFNPTTRISFDVARESRISLEIYNMLGQKIRTLIDNENLQPGIYDQILWDAKDDQGNSIANGIYYLVFTAKDINFRQVRKMVFMK